MQEVDKTFRTPSPFTMLERAAQRRYMGIFVDSAAGVTLSLVAIYAAVTFLARPAWQYGLIAGISVPMAGLLFLAPRMMRRGQTILSGYILLIYLLVLMTVNHSLMGVFPAIAPGYLTLIIAAGIILGPTGSYVTAVVATVLWLVAFTIDRNGLLPPTPLPGLLPAIIVVGINASSFLFTAFVSQASTSNLRKALDDANYELVQANRQLREASQLKSRFVARMSHDLRTPLNAITLATDLSLRSLYGPLNEKQEKAFSQIADSTNRLQALIDDILDITKIEAGRLELVEKPFQVKDLAEAVRATLGQKALDKGLAFSVTVAPNMPPQILGDLSRLTQILINLTDNAIKFTEQGQVSVQIEPKNTHWHMAVRDTGRGIHGADYDIIFEEFRQADRTTRSTVGGTGLGLAIARHLVELMKGEIRLSSKIGKGSTFEVILPLKIAKKQPDSTQQP